MFSTVIHRKVWFSNHCLLTGGLTGIPVHKVFRAQRTELGFQGLLSASGEGPLNAFFTTKNNN